MPFLKDLLHGAEKVVETAAPIVGGIVGGPVGAAVGQGISKLTKVASQTKTLGGPGLHAHAPSFTPSSSGDLGEARDQDRARMKEQYGI